MRLILGGPGCGKTTRLMALLEEALTTCEPDQVGFITFTRRAAEEARDRAMKRFGYSADDLPHFRTIHSLAFRQLGLNPDQVMNSADYKELGDSLGLKIGAVDPEFGVVTGGDLGDRLVFIEQLSRLRGEPLERGAKHLNLWHARRFEASLAAFKKARGVIDFTDMIASFVHSPVMPRFKVLFIDEAQDLSPLAWKVADALIETSEQVFIAGDDDQSIFQWAGADVPKFLSLPATSREVLPISHRLNRATWTMAEGIAQRIRSRYAKEWRSRDEDGKVNKFERVEDVDPAEGSWLVLARHNYLLEPVLGVLRRQGHPYEFKGQASTDNPTVRAILAWEKLRRGETVSVKVARALLRNLRPAYVRTTFPKTEDDAAQVGLARLGFDAVPADWMEAVMVSEREREYYRAIKRRGESLDPRAIRIKVSTIHASKGGEADHVMLLRDMSDTCHQDYVRRPDDECRVFYVGVSRAIKSLNIQHPRTSRFFHLPN